MTILPLLRICALLATFAIATGTKGSRRLGSSRRTLKEDKGGKGKDKAVPNPVVVTTTAPPQASPVSIGTGVTDSNTIPVDRAGGSEFQVKMYWELGYFWQEETTERRWCWECRGDCIDGSSVWIQECNANVPNQYFELGASSGTEVQVKPYNTDVCLSQVPGTREILLRTCDVTSPSQFWAGFRTDGTKFELWPNGTAGTRCVTNDSHHPKPEELLYLATCSVARSSTTSYLNVI